LETIEIESRKLNFLIDQAKTTRKSLDKRFKLIDESMQKVSVGTEMYLPGAWGEYHPIKITKIVCPETGIVEYVEPGWFQHETQLFTTCILNLYFELPK